MPAGGNRAAHQAILGAISMAAAAELLMRNTYHQMSGEAGAFVRLAGIFLVLSAALWIPTRWMPQGAVDKVGRACVLVALVCYLEVVLAGSFHRAVAHATTTPALTAVFGSVVIASALGLLWLPGALWRRGSRALAFGCMVFVASSPLTAAYLAPPLSWPPLSAEQARPEGESVTLFLLLDEMNANVAQPMLDALQAAGLHVAFRPIRTAGEHTMKAVPAMFVKQDFSQSKVCGTTAVCSEKSILDFSRIRASRADIDVVGFFHPYRAIQGLRSCRQMGAMTNAVLDPDRWRCAALRRLRLLDAARHAECDLVAIDIWQGLVKGTVDAIWEAPVWRRGGLLFAHIPLPHPPGPVGAARLQDAYARNVELSNELVRQMVSRARAGGQRRVSLVVFSDHPLRQRFWCATETYAGPSCGDGLGEQEKHVPLIVASTEGLIDLESVQTNAQIFDLAARLP